MENSVTHTKETTTDDCVLSLDVPLLGNNDDKNCRSLKNVLVSRDKPRAIRKNGDSNIRSLGISRKFYLKDTFTTVVDMRWRWTVAVFVVGFFVSWMIFALGWWLVLDIHGDFEEAHLPYNQKASNWTPCVTEMYGFLSCFLFSVETQYTTGYGIKAPTDECVDAIALMCLQNIVGLVIEAFLVGTVFAKLTRPKLRAQTIKFSKYAVICKRNDELCLMFRIGDMRERSRLIDVKLICQLVCSQRTKEGEPLNNYATSLKAQVDDCDRDLLLLWPITVVHKIDEDSPLYNMSAIELSKSDFEIIVSLEGVIESTDQTTQARTSYLSNEIIWGHTFEPLVRVAEQNNGYVVDYLKFDNIMIAETFMCSAAELDKSNRNGLT